MMLGLFLKHLLADFVWQTPKMVEEKGIYGATAGVQHSAIHGLLTAFVFSFWIPVGGALIYGIIDLLAHYHIDWAKININKKYNYTVENPKFWFWLGLDQFMHQMTYVLLVISVLS